MLEVSSNLLAFCWSFNFENRSTNKHFTCTIVNIYHMIVLGGLQYYNLLEPWIKYSGRKWCGTATAEWDSFQNHPKVVRILWNSQLVCLWLKWSNMFICVTFWQLWSGFGSCPIQLSLSHTTVVHCRSLLFQARTIYVLVHYSSSPK